VARARLPPAQPAIVLEAQLPGPQAPRVRVPVSAVVPQMARREYSGPASDRRAEPAEAEVFRSERTIPRSGI